ncbi:MAG: hypothetical protein COB14_08675 [Alphaproteobacteria bacterium]|nr:MAG: hypothetical protein COB14_08675 [Alphaproteobacteria bacterium]
MDKNITTKTNKEKHMIIAFYIVFFTSIFISFIPVNIASLFAMMICVCTLSAIYSVRSTAEEDGITENHMTYLIRTFWRANLYILIASLGSLLYLTILVNYVTLQPCISYISDHWTYIIRNGNFETISTIMKPCGVIFYDKNHHHLIIAAFIAFAPSLLYLLFRCIRGWWLILKNKRVPTNKL